MQTTIRAILLSICVMPMSATAQDQSLKLEPCIDGEVSASGRFPTQQAEDQFQRAKLENADLDLEPCVTGDVSASGAFSNQEAEDRHRLREMEKGGKYGVTVSE